MNIIFISNYFTHHQLPLSDALYQLTGGNYMFLATDRMSDDRKSQGWTINTADYVHEIDWKNREDVKKCIDAINRADAVIQGSLYDKLIEERVHRGGLTFIYNERLYKSFKRYIKLPLYFFKGLKYKNCYILTASAFTALDYLKTRSYINRCYKFGYYPETTYYPDIDALLNSKKHNQILWVARFIDWKHPEYIIYIAKELKDKGYQFQLNMIGIGLLETKIKGLVSHYQLNGCVRLLGSMTPGEVRKHMEESDIFLMTSNKNEGWGAVLNEAMNSGCAVVAGHEIGAVPYLINNGINGCIYRDGSISEAVKKIQYLMDNPIIKREMGRKAVETICNTWNAYKAASNLLTLINNLKGDGFSTISDGPCSKALIIKDNWYKCQ